jgi:predicted ribosomally synthesized peptide with SipW-like signal peptide
VKKILISIMTLALVVGMIGAAYAEFSDTEDSTGNTITAGTLDLTGGSYVAGTYTGPVTNYTVTEGGNGANGNVIFGDDIGIKPGESGSITWTLVNAGSLDGTLTIAAEYTSDENSLREPEEALGDDGDDDGGEDMDGELDENLVFDLYQDGGAEVTDGDIDDVVAYLNAEAEAMAATAQIVYKLDWELPGVTTSVAQSDDLVLDIVFTLTQ